MRSRWGRLGVNEEQKEKWSRGGNSLEEDRPRKQRSKEPNRRNEGDRGSLETRWSW